MKGLETESEKTGTRFELACGRFFIRLLMIILPILVIDYASRFFVSGHRSKIERKFPVEVVRHPKPYVMFGGVADGILPEGEKLNNLGYRGKSPTEAKSLDEFRIFVLGGSTVFNGEPPISVLLEELFAENGDGNVQVYNFGVVSSVSGMELARIVFEIAEFGPDLIIMYNGSNDVLLPVTCDPRPGYPFNFLVYENNPVLESDVRSYPGLSLSLYGSNLARLFFADYFAGKFVPLDAERKNSAWESEGWKKAIARDYVANVVRAGKVADAFDSRFLGFFQPMVYYKDSLAPEEQTDSFRPGRKQHSMEVRELIRSEISLLPEEDKALLIDLSDVFDETTEQVFLDYTHTNQLGKMIIVEAIYHCITSRSLAQPHP
ncbi:MAG: hypothetical protein JW720_13480 [Sedimentisphaerales bacterium]|nr:hypothetical protein [Sedimentisphaerales bacterium]